MRGRYPKPREIKVLEGNPGKRRLPKEAPKIEGEIVKPPFLKGAGAKIWKAFAPICQRLGTLTAADVPAFARWCHETAEYQESPRNYPAARLTHLNSLEAKFCLTPADRARYFAGTQPPDPSRSSAVQGKQNPFKVLAG